MFIVNSYVLAVLFCFITMLCWGSWANTQKLAGKTWRYELFYWDYVIGMVIFALILGLTMGSFGSEGRSFFTDLGQASWKSICLCLAGGIIFNVSNILLSASTSIAGLSVAFPLGVGLAFVLGVLNNYFFVQAKGNPWILFLGVLLAVIAIICNGVASGRMNREKSTQNRKGIILAIIAGILMSFFSPLTVKAIDLDNFANPAAGMLTPYTALFILSIGVFLCNLVVNTICMRRPFVGEPVTYRQYFHGSAKIHLIGMLGGAIWCLGTAFNYIAAGKAGAAISYALGQGSPMIAAIWGVFIWKEFKGADKKTIALIAIMFAFFITGLGCVVAAGNTKDSPEKINLIFETDMGNDVDDALALDMIFKYQDSGLVNLLAIGINKRGTADGKQWPAEFVDIMRTWYGYPEVSVGFIRDGAPCEDYVNYAQKVCEMTADDGSPLFARTETDYDSLPDVLTLYRQVLAAQPDNSVTLVSVGFSTNLAALLDTPGDEFSPLNGKRLVAAKVKMTSVMAGKISDPNYHEFNVVKDIAAAQKFFAEWPAPIVVSPFELGAAVLYPGQSIADDFGWAGGAHPAVEAYKSYKTMPYDRPTWDMTSVLYAVEGDSYFTVSPAGTISIDDEGGMTYAHGLSGNRQYLSIDEEQGDALLARMKELLLTIPRNRE